MTPMYSHAGVDLFLGDCREVLKCIPDQSVQCVVTSPPYLGLRDYGTASWDGGDSNCDHVQTYKARRDTSGGVTGRDHGTRGVQPHTSATALPYRDTCGKCGARRIDQQIGLEPTVQEYVAEMVSVFREVRRVLRDDGTVWLNLGDSYATHVHTGDWGKSANKTPRAEAHMRIPDGLKPKDLIGMPWRVALALQADGWWLRSDIIWCLSGGARVYARTQKGDMPTMIKDLVRLNPATVQLWNGEKWTQVLGWGETPRPDVAYEIELRTGERIGCTANHEWPTQRGNVRADELTVGDVIATCRLPEPERPRNPTALDDKAVGWFVGLYLAEGSRSETTIQIASHSGESERFARLAEFAAAYDGTCRVHKTSANGSTANLYGPIINGIIDAYVSGRVAKDKHLNVRCWQRSDEFLRAVLDGYLSGDGHWDAGNARWRIGFTKNDALAEDLRTLTARLGVPIRLRRVNHMMNGAKYPGWRGEMRYVRSGHRNTKQDGEVIAIGHSRARKFYDISVADEPHLFALASGVLTHNSKPNPMPESVTDRPTRSHEYIFLLSKKATYYYDADAIAEDGVEPERKRLDRIGGANGHSVRHSPGGMIGATTKRNRRDVWSVSTQAFPAAHFAVFPEALIRPCILAGTSARGACPQCGAPWRRVSGRDAEPPYVEPSEPDYYGNGKNGIHRKTGGQYQKWLDAHPKQTVAWEPTCTCGHAETVPCVTLDPFCGAGTTLLVAKNLNRHAVGIELNPDYCRLIVDRLAQDVFALSEVTT